KGIQLSCVLTETAILIVSFGVGSLKFQIIIKNGKQPPRPPPCPTLEDWYRPFAETPRSPTDYRKPTFNFAGSRHSPSMPKTRKLSSNFDNQFFRLVVGSAE
ncbi:MAG: hypothetical protein Q7T07_06535, partial [Burkholderiaceae bacterium]|nr:hypothetical protein [Burkholderiaceae bacterium]